jgi:hypothetical protein
MSQHFRMHDNDIPREVTDASQLGLHAKIDEIIAFLQRERDTEPPVPDTSEEIAELKRTIEDLTFQVGALKAQALDVPEPVNVGSENMQQEPAIRWAKVVECYNRAGAVWTNYETEGLVDANGFAFFCKAHPCDPTGSYVDVATDLYIEFPYSNVGADYEHKGLGVSYCLPGALISYFVQAGHTINGHEINGMEAGADGADAPGGVGSLSVRQLPWVLKKPDGSGWGVTAAPFFSALASLTSTKVKFVKGAATFDGCGRAIVFNPDVDGSVYRTLRGEVTISVPGHGDFTGPVVFYVDDV